MPIFWKPSMLIGRHSMSTRRRGSFAFADGRVSLQKADRGRRMTIEVVAGLGVGDGEHHVG
jgi:hypothetical protein